MLLTINCVLGSWAPGKTQCPPPTSVAEFFQVAPSLLGSGFSGGELEVSESRPRLQVRVPPPGGARAGAGRGAGWGWWSESRWGDCGARLGVFWPGGVLLVLWVQIVLSPPSLSLARVFWGPGTWRRQLEITVVEELLEPSGLQRRPSTQIASA